MVVFKDPGSVPENWKPVQEEENLEAGSSMQFSEHVAPEASASDALERRPPIGYCSRCQNGKPPRCHHCSVCKQPACQFGLVISWMFASCSNHDIYMHLKSTLLNLQFI